MVARTTKRGKKPIASFSGMSPLLPVPIPHHLFSLLLTPGSLHFWPKNIYFENWSSVILTLGNGDQNDWEYSLVPAQFSLLEVIKNIFSQNWSKIIRVKQKISNLFFQKWSNEDLSCLRSPVSPFQMIINRGSKSSSSL